MATTSVLPLSVGTKLAHAFVSQLAETRGIRAVFAKGPIANAHGLRDPKVSSDVDVFIDPSRIEDFAQALSAAGWRERPSSFAQKQFIVHSRSFIHPLWPCDIDVHMTFPGFLASPQQCFETLWAHRGEITVAGRPVFGADLVASIVISALHALRSPESTAHRAELETLTIRTQQRLDDDQRAELVAIADRLGALEPLRPFFEGIGLRVTPTRKPDRALALWRLQSQQANRAGSWFEAIAHAELRHKPALVVRALFPSRRDLLIEYPELETDRLTLAKTRVVRLGRAARALPRALRTYFVQRPAMNTGTPVGSTESATAPDVSTQAPHPTPSDRPEEVVAPAQTVSPASSFRRNDLVAWVETSDTLYVLDLTRLTAPVPLSLNLAAAEVWRQLSHTLTLDELCLNVARDCGIPVEIVRPDLEGLIVVMRSHGLLTDTSAQSEPTPPAAPLTVTCVIPTHNRDESMLQALESVRGQRYRPERIVVADDTGSASTREAVLRVAAEDKRVGYHDAADLPRKAAGASRNAGAEGATSDLLAFLDDDDTWDAAFLESAVAELERSNADLVVTWGSLRRGDIVLDHNWNAEPGFTADQIITRNPGVTGSNFVVRRSAFEAIDGFDAGLWVYNDLDFFVRFLDAGFVYSVVRQDLVRQVSTGGDHLSSRSERRALGIEAYRAKYADRLSAHQHRSLTRSIHLARLFRDQTRPRRVAHLAGVIANSTLSDSVGALRRRLTKAPSYN